MNSKFNEEEAQLEEDHFIRALRAFSSFSRHMNRRIHNHHQDWNRLDPVDKELIPEYKSKLEKLPEIFQLNQMFFDKIVHFSGDSNVSSLINDATVGQGPTDRDFENLRSTLRQLVRDWSVEGETEREQCYSIILKSVEELFRENYSDDSERANIKILVPGAGLGRLAWELTRIGFTVQGNEFSLYMLLTSQFILNFCTTAQEHAIIPFAFPLSNHQSVSDSFREIMVPDVVPFMNPLGNGADFSMVAGDFLEIYDVAEERSSWDFVVTCFFLDTAQNVLHYLRVIFAALKPGGTWINFGPLQYHFEGSAELSIELTWEEVKVAAERIGFIFTKMEVLDDWQPYAHDQRSLSKTMYRPIFSIAKRPL